MILLCDSGAMRLDYSKNMSVHVSTYCSYNFSALMPIVKVVTLIKTCVCSMSHHETE
jgi:hypothetical protein